MPDEIACTSAKTHAQNRLVRNSAIDVGDGELVVVRDIRSEPVGEPGASMPSNHASYGVVAVAESNRLPTRKLGEGNLHLPGVIRSEKPPQVRYLYDLDADGPEGYDLRRTRRPGDTSATTGRAGGNQQQRAEHARSQLTGRHSISIRLDLHARICRGAAPPDLPRGGRESGKRQPILSGSRSMREAEFGWRRAPVGWEAGTMRIRVASAGVIVCAVVVLSGCASPSTQTRATNAVRSTPTPHPSPPPPRSSYCRGIADESDARKLAEVGTRMAKVLLLGTVSHRPTAGPRPGPRFKLAAYRVLAGSRHHHPLRQIIGDPVRGKHLLVLFWDGFAWEIAAGLLGGDFVVTGTRAYERCPNFDQPQVPAYTRRGITALAALEQVFEKALS